MNDKAIEMFKKSLSLDPPLATKANTIKLLKQLGIEYNESKQEYVNLK